MRCATANIIIINNAEINTICTVEKWWKDDLFETRLIYPRKIMGKRTLCIYFSLIDIRIIDQLNGKGKYHTEVVPY